jgi:hypothetical protein
VSFGEIVSKFASVPYEMRISKIPCRNFCSGMKEVSGFAKNKFNVSASNVQLPQLGL